MDEQIYSYFIAIPAREKSRMGTEETCYHFMDEQHKIMTYE